MIKVLWEQREFLWSRHSNLSKYESLWLSPLPTTPQLWACCKCGGRIDRLRLPALMDLYIHPLYVLVSKILSSILNSPALYIILYPLYALWEPLITLSKYIHV
jgi:hypothetical protein